MSDLGEFRDVDGKRYLDVYPNHMNGPSERVVVWARDHIHGYLGQSCPISLDPREALAFGQKVAAIAQSILDGTDWPKDAR